jgi:hypothetical protein
VSRPTPQDGRWLVGTERELGAQKCLTGGLVTDLHHGIEIVGGNMERSTPRSRDADGQPSFPFRLAVLQVRLPLLVRSAGAAIRFLRPPF